MTSQLENQVSQAVSAWVSWLPRWSPGSGLIRSRICRRCLGSPFIRAAALEAVPHAVQHALVMRLMKILSQNLDLYILDNLPLMQAELQKDELRKQRMPYRPSEGLDPEFEGLELDPPENPEQPFLFTLNELADTLAQVEPVIVSPGPALSPTQLEQLRGEIKKSDEYSASLGNQICLLLLEFGPQISQAVSEYVEPKIQDLFSHLETELFSPPGGDFAE